MARFGREFVRAATQPAFTQGLFTAAQAAGGAPARAQRREELSQFDPNTVEGLTSLAQYYQGQGDMQSAAKIATAAREMANKQNQEQALANRKAQVKTQAENLGLDDVADQIENVTDAKELGDLVGTMVDYRLKNLPTQTPAQRKHLARQRGISDKLFEELGLAKAPDQVFNDVLTGQRGGDIEFFLKDGKVLPFRTEGGQVYDRENNTWTSAQQLGLRKPPPEVQKIENISGTMAEEIMGQGVERLSDGLDAANKAVTSVESIDTSLENIDNMYTGYGATFRMDVARAARVAGIDISAADQIENTEQYASLAGARVADYITNLGAGTGLSDADREFAQKVVAGDIGMSTETMRRLLTTIRKQNVRTINQYNSLRSTVEDKLTGSEKAAMAFYPLVDMPPERVEPEVDDTDLTTGSTVTVRGTQYIVD
jgi:chaperonin cofactor prefoldin